MNFRQFRNLNDSRAAGCSHRLACRNVLCRLSQPGKNLDKPSIVFKFGGAALSDAECIRQITDISCSFPDEWPVLVLSAMGKTTNMLLEAGSAAQKTDPDQVQDIPALKTVKELHVTTCSQLQVEPHVVSDVFQLLSKLEQLLVGISITQEMSARAQDSLVSYGERLSTRIVASYLRNQGVSALQHDAWDVGFTSTDEFTNADVLYEHTLPQIAKALSPPQHPPHTIPVVTGFCARGLNTGAITTLGRGGSDLTATAIGAALVVDEVVLWKDVTGVLTCDPRVVGGTRTINKLTFEEASELAYYGAQVLHPQAMVPAQNCTEGCAVRVRNCKDRAADGTVIVPTRDMSTSLLSCIVIKRDVTLLDVVCNRMLGQPGFLSDVFSVFKMYNMSIDVIATSEVSVSLTLDPKKLPGQLGGEPEQKLDSLQRELAGRGAPVSVSVKQGAAIISLICNVERSSEVLAKVFQVMCDQNVNVQMISQGASKTNISMIVDDAQADPVAQALHDEFFGA